MQKKLLQYFLIFLIIIFPVFAYYKYFYSNNMDAAIDKKKNIASYEEVKDLALEKIEAKDTSSNLIENLKYVSKDSKENKYEIFSKYGKISDENQDIILMTDVTAIITMIGSSPIYISASVAEYNNQTYETIFSDNVLLTYITHKIKSKNLELSFEKNLATIYNNIVYTNLRNTILADKLEFDMLSKNSKIFMNDNNKKIKITSIQSDGNN